MDHPGTHWTIGFAAALLAWTWVRVVVTRYLLQPAWRINRAGELHMATIMSSATHPAARLAASDQIRAGVPEVFRAVRRSRRFNRRVHAPVTIALAVPTVVLALWGVFTV